VKTTYLKVSVGLVLFILIAVSIGCKISALQGMFQPHSYNWRTGMPPLRDQVTAFQQSNKRWPTNYDDLVGFMKQTMTNFVSEPYDRVDFATKPFEKLEITVYVFESGLTNHITLKPSHKDKGTKP